MKVIIDKIVYSKEAPNIIKEVKYHTSDGGISGNYHQLTKQKWEEIVKVFEKD